MTDTVGRREFDSLSERVERHEKTLLSTAVEVREISTNQKNDSKKLDNISSSVQDISKQIDERLNKVSSKVNSSKIQMARVLAVVTPINGLIAFVISRFLAK